MKFIFDSSLVLYLPLHEMDGSSFMSRDAYGHLGTVTGALWRPNGRYFDGLDDGINCGHNSILDITEELTLETWVKLAALPDGGSANHVIVGIDGQYFLYQKDGGVDNGKNIYLELWGTVTHIAKKTGDEVSGDWEHLVLRYSKSDGALKLYIDSAEEYSFAFAESLTTTADDLYIGGAPGEDRTIDGPIGEVRIYNRALTPGEIQSNYLATKWRYQ